ncbi:MAG TPA: glycosyltransferase N-terminal domain-containing protein [Bacteroidales bacterium]|nr:3-deoxy-D-manno-octulosonic acid transferase [Bacteroidales bacterium]MDI9574143.1 glycosyltransferase N-terminal domain-containing protein [Bacteroidota bacterium]MBP9511699.1 3-deoxy-D-manno-octulosonic acid transferase [Bacteroidales bacterium]HNQ59999.1 glycosyltransferase N-terminal domain-containing protein [Bacteroidales bacterium]HNV17175.1 glycosyltransferase N-terminal domain-containing protein [Bacteroidales bacterium]
MIKVSSIFNPKAKEWIKGRKNLFQRLQDKIDRDKPLVWFHCASLGEFEQGRPLIEAFHQSYPSFKILITFFSPSGYNVRKNYIGADYIFYLPADTPVNAKKFIEIIKPKLVIFIKYEFWLNYLKEIHARDIALLLVSGIFRPQQVFFKWYGKIFRQQLKAFSHFYVQNETSAQLLKNIGFDNVSASGDTRFDRVETIAANSQPLHEIKTFCADKKVIIGGSVWPADLKILEPFIQQASENFKFILAPHEVNRDIISGLLEHYGDKAITYTALKNRPQNDEKILIIDIVGILSSVYQFGWVAYIGGGFGVGIHNILEAAVYGIPVFFGPHYRKFQEACDLIERGGAFPINSSDDLLRIILNADFEKNRNKVAKICKEYVLQNTGATKIVMQGINKIIKNKG